ncbi:Ig-like domain repeat protein [Pseudomonas sp. ANT_H12B]|uniref:Ig-like domain repeat protein n=1 Tax=Pseudomonas sp. ANT_H12B TaxID=2597348 RepID=UPI0011EBABC8|nr:Ig-like domain repeat protein [Pseudomonas sp. ANT_H12B]KAA0974850.1 Ig-like domain repeat protein [Pseudomonas sp. ANT_H12B]
MSNDIEKENETTRPAAPTFVYPPQDPDKTKVLAISPVNFQVQVHQEPHLRHHWRLDTQYPGADPGYSEGQSLNGMFTQRVAIQNGPAHFGARAHIRDEWTEWGWIWFTVVAKPTMSPLNGASGPRPRFNGTKTNNSKAVVSLQFSTGKSVTVEGSTSTSWTYQTPVGQEMVPGNYTVTVSYVGVPNSSSTYTFTVGLTPPAITSPLHDAVIIDKLPVVAITGYPGAIATVRKSGNGEVLIGNVLLDGGGRWSGRITREIALGQHYSISVIQKFNGLESQWGPNVRLRMLAPPTITSPTQNQEVDMRITVSGTVNALFKGGTIRIKRDVAGTLLGTATVNTSTGAWQAQLSVNLIPGDYSLTAEHVFSGVTSLGASPVRLKVRPSRPQLTAPDPASGVNPVLTGTGGHTGATLVLSDETGEDLGSMTVTGDSWSVSPRSALLPGGYAFKVRQSISSMQSLWSNVRTYTVRVPRPTLTEPITVTDQKPSFSGTANTWEKQTEPARVKVWNTNYPPYGPVANVSDNRWTSTVTEPWAPGTYRIGAYQLYKGMDSGTITTWVSLVIPAPLPVITGIEREGFSPRITGTCWSGAALELKYSDRPTVDHPVSGTDGNWTFRRDLVFAPW